VSSDPATALTNPARLAALAGTNLLYTPPEASFDRITRLAAKLLSAPVALIALVDANREFIKSCIGLGEPWATTGQTPLSHFLCVHLVATGEPLVIGDARGDPRVSDGSALTSTGLVAHLGVPLATPDGHVLGGLLVADRQPRRWRERDVADLRDAAHLVMTEMQVHANLLERQRAQMRLGQHASQLQQALVGSGDPTVITTTDLDPEGPRIVYANEAACDLLGRGLGELLGVGLQTLLAPGIDPETYQSLCAYLALGLPWTGDIEHLHKGGATEVLRWHVAPLRGADGRISHWVSTQDNRLARDELALRLEETEASFRHLLERVPAMVYTVDPGSPNNVTYVSPQVQTLFGERPEDCVGGNELWERWLHPADRDRVTAHCERTNATGAPFLDEYRIRLRDGRVRWVRDEAVLVHDEAGRPRCWQGILTDITERRQAEAVRKELLARLISAQEDERRRVADDVHDDTLQALAAAIMELQMVGARVDDPVGRLHLARALESLRRSLQSARTLVFNLRPPLLDSSGLGPAIGQQLDQLAQRTGCRSELDWSGDERLDPALEATVFRTVQEALANVAKHAQARNVAVHGWRKEDQLEVQIRDDGLGFVATDPLAGTPGHLGLRAMAERMEMVGGRFAVETGPSSGTTVTLHVPIRPQDDGAEPAVPPPGPR
jgi:PAS domain S-box-containing protein